ncbi:hypothetical protein K439DRAFT_1627223 [Ramaria rubella]|nr:hypothetical protein K439DRAFT_1627223 [Ramaria rubella]
MTPSNSRLGYGKPTDKPILPSHSRDAGPSPLCMTQLASSPLPTITVMDSSNYEECPSYPKQPVAQPMLPRELRPARGRIPSSSSNYNPIRTSPAYSRRRSSIDISMTLSTLSSNSFQMPDASFDLLNGDISFLPKNADGDMSDDFLVDCVEPATPRDDASEGSFDSRTKGVKLFQHPLISYLHAATGHSALSHLDSSTI